MSIVRTRHLILLADDSATQAHRAAQALESAGYRVRLAGNGRQAIDLARRWRPDVIVSDVLMPIMDGFALCREIRHDPTLAQVPVVLYTLTFVGQKDEEFARSIGATRFLVKPDDPADLVKVIHGVMQSGHVATAAPAAADDDAFISGYSERLVAKLEEKISDLQATNQYLEKQNREIQAAHDRLALLLETSQLVSSSLDLDVLLHHLAERLVANLRATFGRVFLLDHAEGDLVVRASHSVRRLKAEPEVGHRISLTDAPFCCAVIERGVPRTVRLNADVPVMTEDERSRFGLQEAAAALLVPMRLGEESLGILIVGEARNWERMPITEEQLDLAQAMASQAVMAIENARLYGVVKQRSLDLERLVDDYVVELAARRKAEETLRRQERRLEELVARLFNVQEEERRHMAYDIHDGPAQMLVGAYQYLQAAERLREESVEKSVEHQQRALETLGLAIQELRQVIRRLRPALLDDFGLSAALKRMLEDWRREAGWNLTFEDGLDAVRFQSELEIAAFRIVQEALANVRKHAETNRVAVRVFRTNDGVSLQVQDWGRGFDRNQVRANVGLESMVERATMLGGRCDIHSQPGEGTCVTVWLPVTKWRNEGD